ncbi:MAG: hypothetical protein R6W82_04185 [bacterium]
MKHRIAALWTGTAVMVALSLLALPADADAQQEEQATKTMYIVGRNDVQVIRLYDEPDPLGTTVETMVPGQTVEVFTDRMYNKYWYKTSEGHYAHSLYLSEVDPTVSAGSGEAGEELTEAQREREDELLEKYKDIQVVNDILVGNVKPGMTMEMVEDAWGQPDDRRILESGPTGDIWLWVYDNEERKVDVVFDHRKRVAEIRARP